MRWFGCLVSALAVAACTASNPAYEDPATVDDAGESTDAGQTDASESTGAAQGSSTRGETSGDSMEDGGASDSGGETPLPAVYCQAELYAINESGDLFLLDVDTDEPTLEPTRLITDPRLGSWAIATDPASGFLYVSEYLDPSHVWRVDPFPIAIDDEPVIVMADALDSMARATFHPDGNLWLGTDDTNRFVWFSPSGRSIGEQTVDSFPWGGDMMFLEPDCAWVPTLDGFLYRVCFPGQGAPPPMTIAGLPAGAQLTGIAVDAMGRVWLSTTDLHRQLVGIHLGETGWSTVHTVAYDMTINDLAPVIGLSGC
jgi:hypothetical protein